MDSDKVYTSIPPQYGYICPKCGAYEFSTEMEIANKPESVLEPKPETVQESSDIITGQEVYDYYQERSGAAGNRADQLAWMFVVMAAAVLFSGHTWGVFIEGAVMAAIYMMLSVLQAVWQTFTSWLFMRQLKKMDVAPKDYPSWVGCGEWLFFWLKMITITIPVIYFAKAILFDC